MYVYIYICKTLYTHNINKEQQKLHEQTKNRISEAAKFTFHLQPMEINLSRTLTPVLFFS